MEIKTLLEQRGLLIFDGAMGTQLQAKGLKTGETPELLNLTAKDLLKEIHRSYIDAGADIISANTFGANSYKLSHSGKSVDEIITAGIINCKEAIKESRKDVFCALDIGPIGQLLEPTGSLKFEETYDIFREEIVAGYKAGADVVLFETMTDLYELKAAILAAKENCDLPIICSMTFEENGRTFTGCPAEAEILLCEGLGVSAVGVNCSLGPKELMPIIKTLCEKSKIPVIVMPNAGLPDPATGEYSIDAEEFSDYAVEIADLGAGIIGGCCGTTPEFIRRTADKVKGRKYEPKKIERVCTICSGTNVVEVSQPRIIGERINPTGKKLFKQALINDDIDYILGQAIEQVGAGADILDVNVGLPDIDEKAMMIKAVKSIQGVTNVPLQIDSTIPEVLEAALRVLGVSNISFGLPNRELLNHIFLTMALENGLDLPIINPNVASMTGAVRAFKLLKAIDVNSVEYIAAYGSDTPTAVAKPKSSEVTLEYAIDNGLKADAAKITEQLLTDTDPMVIINERLIPALDKTGTLFEQGKIFLPQLILSAGVAQSCFDVIKAHLAKNNSETVSKGKIVLATVKGDVHDIGKNIVKVLLENYGYTVIDLGKDVEYQAVVDAARKHEVKLVGLSALMTTTLKSMEETIKLIRDNGLPCKVVVGGAVLTPEYAEKIGADFYAKDAKETVDIAKKVIG